MESQLFRLTVPQIAALNVGGKNSLIEKFMRGEIDIDDVRKGAHGGRASGSGLDARGAMATPGMTSSRLFSDVSAVGTSIFSQMIPTKAMGWMADRIESVLPGTARNDKDSAQRQKGINVLSDLINPLGWSNLIQDSASFAGIGGEKSSPAPAAPKEVNVHVDINVHGGKDFAGVGADIARHAAAAMGDSMREEAAKSQNTPLSNGMFSSTATANSNPGTDRHPTR
jgi:hypothetical protein